MLRYFARSVLDGSPYAETMFSELVTLGERWLEDHLPDQTSDPTAYAALLVAAEVGTLIMREQLARVLGGDILGSEGHLRVTKPKLDFYSKPLLDPDVANGAKAAIEDLLTEVDRGRRK